MNRTLLITALFLGFSVAVFSQTGMIKYVDYGTKTGVYVDDTKADDRDIQFTIENDNVKVVAGEYIYIATAGISKVIVVKTSGEYVGRIDESEDRDTNPPVR